MTAVPQARTRASNHGTAIARNVLSRPVQLAADTGLLTQDTTLFDYGCGRGDDVRLLRGAGFRADGWDPVSRPRTPLREADVVNLGFVVNVIDDPTERDEALRRAWRLASRVLIVSARLTNEMTADLQPQGDGWITSKGTFQKFFAQPELRSWIDGTLGTECIAAAPGVFLVFRDEALAQDYLRERRRRPAASVAVSKRDELFERNKALLEDLMRFYSERGRVPVGDESTIERDLTTALGSVARAWQVVTHVTGRDPWTSIQEQRRSELTVHLALGRLRRRPRFTGLPDSMQRDVRAFFGSYKAACEESDALLWGAGDLVAVAATARAAGIGKTTATDLYVHRSGVADLPPLLQVYEGCARWIAGDVEGSNVVKLAWNKPKVSYLAYPTFDRLAHPILEASVVVNLADQSLELRDYGSRPNPPILHRKEHLVAQDYPGREKFEKLSRQEERHGLYADAHRIGTRNGWNEALVRAGVKIRGHRLFVA